MKTKENGVTLIVLVLTIVLILILTSVGVIVGTSTLDTATFTQFKSELKVIQSKVNELNQNNENVIGTPLIQEQKDVLNIEAVSNVIYKNISNNDDKSKIQDGFRYWDKKCIQDNFGLDNVKREYLINVEYRYVIFPKGFEYQGTTYYMIDQIEDEVYNVRYNDKNEKTGSFDVNISQEDDKWKIEITNIEYIGYNSKWVVKYKLDSDINWKTSNNLTFYVEQNGKYNIKLVSENGENIELENKELQVGYNVNVGDYVEYEPSEANTSSILEELQLYSGTEDNTESTLKQELTLNWRVLDIIKDENGKEAIRLISEMPTNSTVSLYGAKGYNNAVYLLDKVCKTLYDNSQTVQNVQNLKIEDIQKYLKYDYTSYENEFVDTGKYGGFLKTLYTTNKQYPSIYKQEKYNGVNGTKQLYGLDLSEQTVPINEELGEPVEKLGVTQTHWDKSTLESEDFKQEEYYNLFIKHKYNYPTYWISSRCVNAYYGNANFGIKLYSGNIITHYLYYSYQDSNGGNFPLRPVVTLKSDIKIDTEDTTKDGKTVDNAWKITI